MSQRTLVLLVLVGTTVGLGYRGYRENGFLPLAAIAAEQGKILYYRNPMGLADTSPTPKKDAMGMDYIANLPHLLNAIMRDTGAIIY